MIKRVAVVMDPIESIKPYKDTSFAMMLEAQRRGYELHYLQISDLYVDAGVPMASTTMVTELRDQNHDYYSLGETDDRPLTHFDVILLRTDPPVDSEYLYATYILELAEQRGVCIVNSPQAVRDFNEKLAIFKVPELITPTLVSRDSARLKAFIAEHGDVILKPLDGMGGKSIFKVRHGDANTGVIIETLTNNGERQAMAQRFIPEITEGDKRILMIAGEPAADYSIARIPTGGDHRGNLAAGGDWQGKPLSDRDREICAVVGPLLQQHGLLWVGLDVIGAYLTEINVTSPTCAREYDKAFGLNLSGQMFDAIDRQIQRQRDSA